MILCFVVFNWDGPYRFIMVGPELTNGEMWPCDWFYLANYCYWKKAE